MQVMWGLATLRHREPELWRRLPAALPSSLAPATAAAAAGPQGALAPGLTPQQASNVLWALAALPPPLDPSGTQVRGHGPPARLMSQRERRRKGISIEMERKESAEEDSW